MGTRIRLLIAGVAVVSATGFVVWYVTVYRPSADVDTDESVQGFVSRAALEGDGVNQAATEDVVVSEDESGATIHLAPEDEQTE